MTTPQDPEARLAALMQKRQQALATRNPSQARSVGIDPYGRNDETSQVEGLRRAVLRGAPEGQEFNPLWTRDDTHGADTIAGKPSPGWQLQQKLTDQSRGEARMRSQFDKDPLAYVHGGYDRSFGMGNPWTAFDEALYHNQGTLGTEVKVGGLGAGFPESPAGRDLQRLKRSLELKNE